jgi:hypothetical protein
MSSFPENSCLSSQGIPCIIWHRYQGVMHGLTPFGQLQIIFANKEGLALFQRHHQGNTTQYIHEKKPNSTLPTRSLLV